MRYEVQPLAPNDYAVVDRRHPLLRPVHRTHRRLDAMGLAWRLSLRAAWGW